ncbi:MAG: ABC transporter substrate-binding protein [Candidatus Tectomicrobia bacterium]
MRLKAWVAAMVVVMLCVGMLVGSATAGEQPKPGGTLRIAFASDIHSGRFTLNRRSPAGAETGWIMHNTHSRLVTLDPNFGLAPDLAKSWDVIDGGKAYVFHLQENVKFHDGTACDAAAVKWNFDALLAQGKKAWVYVYFNLIESTEVVDKHTFKIIMKEPAALLPTLPYFGGIPIGSPTAEKKYGKDWNRHPVGTGPFVFNFEAYRPDERIILDRNPHYFKKDQYGNTLPYLDRIEIRVIKDPTASMAALRTRQVDFLQRVNPQHVPIMERAKGVTLVTSPDRSPVVCLMNLRHPPFDDLRVRRAVGGYGLNRDAIATTVFQSRTKALVSVLPHGVQDHLNLTEMYPYDPAKAVALLQEAGYDANTPLTFELILNNDAVFFADVATLMKSQMEKIGVQMKLVLTDKPAWLDRFFKYNYEMALEDFGALLDINQRSVSFFRGAKSNYMGVESPELEALTMQWRRQSDAADRRETSHAIQRLMADQLYWCNITGSPYFQAYRDYVKGYPFMNQVYVFWHTTWLDK